MCVFCVCVCGGGGACACIQAPKNVSTEISSFINIFIIIIIILCFLLAAGHWSDASFDVESSQSVKLLTQVFTYIYI